MNLDCDCGNARRDKRRGWTPDQCRICWYKVNAGLAKPKKAVVLPPGDGCRHRGGEVRRIACGTCRGKVERKVFACGLHGECAIGEAGVRDCRNCDDRSVWPIRFDHHNLAPERKGKRFNASIIEFRNKLILSYRDGWAGSEIWTIELDRDFRPVGEPVKADMRRNTGRGIDWRCPGCSFGREDPRLFIHHGKLHVSFIGVQGRGTKVTRTNQCYARLRDDRTVEDAWMVNVPNRRGWEKNWTFLTYDGTLYAVYLTHPRHVIVKVEGSNATVVHDEPNYFPWDGGELRGGSTPLRIGDEYLSFPHDRADVNGQTVYRMWCYSFDAKPPFAPRRMIREPLLVADPATKPAGQYVACVFPCGAVRVGDDIVVSMGVHDRHTELRKFSFADLDSRLRPIDVPIPAEPKAPPGLVSVTIGIGDKFRDLAATSAESVRRFCGVEHSIILNERHLECCPPQHLFPDVPRRIFWLKWLVPLIYPDIERWIYHDADFRFVREPEANVLDMMRSDSRLLAVEDDWSDAPPGYLNAGFYVANRNHFDLFRWCKENYWKVDETFGEQCVMHAGIKALGVPVLALPREYNTMKPGQCANPRAVHGYWSD